MEKVIELESKF